MPIFSGTGVSAVSTVTATAPITSTGGNAPVISLNNTAVVAGSYTSPTITVDAQGRLTSAVNGSAQAAIDASSIRAAASDYAAVNYDGVTTAQRVTSTLTGQNIGTGDFSMWARARISSNSAGGLIAVSPTASTPFGADALSLYVGSGSLFINKRSATDVGQGVLAISNFVSNYSGQVVDVVVTKSTASALWSVYINGSLAGTSVLYTSENIASTYCHVGAQAGVPWFGRIYRAVVFNRALSASDVTELITTGVNSADNWGTQTGATSGSLVASKRYRITTFVAGDSFTNIGAASNATGVEFVSTGTTPTTWTNASTLTRIGAIVDFDFTVGTGYQTYDRSTNNLHGTMFGGVEFTHPRRIAVLYAMTNTSTPGNQQMLNTLAIPTNAIIEDIIVNSTGSCTVSVGNASAGTQIVNAAAVVSGRQKLTLATPFSSTGNLWVNSSTAATLQFTISYTIAL